MRLLVYVGILLICLLLIDNVESKKSKKKKGIEGSVKEIKDRYGEKRNEKNEILNKKIKNKDKNSKIIDEKISVVKKIVKRDVSNNENAKNVGVKIKKNKEKRLKQKNTEESRKINECAKYFQDEEIVQDSTEPVKPEKKQKRPMDRSCNKMIQTEMDNTNIEQEEEEYNCQEDNSDQLEEDIEVVDIEEEEGSL